MKKRDGAIKTAPLPSSQRRGLGRGGGGTQQQRAAHANWLGGIGPPCGAISVARVPLPSWALVAWGPGDLGWAEATGSAAAAAGWLGGIGGAVDRGGGGAAKMVPLVITGEGRGGAGLGEIAAQVALAREHWMDGINFDFELPAKVGRS
ncbi:hypothetical protein TSOC_009930 [Tetrabaena socialis]|uniref:Uncharacterized protein n=1 Tax=Tetrabaena socialis TaxID=47790 RepID=A0A2J7ZUI8_9CHLO|nr:hypothetical protein TSOC_009930 [Tetrabaena socialis]|eukprot:PNH03945.1 hypothetical protein TSOC_009930 [Tetrabaena socialis]